MMLRSGIGLALVTWVTAAATLLAGWPAPGPGCACTAPAPSVPAGCCCAKDAAPRSCCQKSAPAPVSCCEQQSPARTQADPCHCSPAAPEPAAPALPPRPAADLDEFGPFAPLAVETPGSAWPPAGHPVFGSLAHPAHAPPIDLTISLSRLTC